MANEQIQAFDWGKFWTDTHSFFGIPMYNVVTFLLIFSAISYIYDNVFRTKKLPVLKNAVVYGLILIGSFFLLVFQLDADMPILYSLSVAIGLMVMYKVRVMIDKRKSGQ